MSQHSSPGVKRGRVWLQHKLALGNLDAKRDWRYAGDYVEAMWRMLQHEKADDFCVATGVAYSLREFLGFAFGALDLDWKEYVEIDARYFRPAEVDHLEGDASKARDLLGWTAKTSLQQLVAMMIESDSKLAERELVLKEAGHEDLQRAGYR